VPRFLSCYCEYKSVSAEARPESANLNAIPKRFVHAGARHYDETMHGFAKHTQVDEV